MTPTEKVLERLEAVRPTGEGKWQARCPAHDDRVPSLSIAEKPNGDVLLHDHGGCATEQIVAAMDLEMTDLFAGTSNGHSDVEAVYRYTDEQEVPLFEVVRFAGKRFRQRSLTGAGA
jgi:hypothetical protein